MDSNRSREKLDRLLCFNLSHCAKILILRVFLKKGLILYKIIKMALERDGLGLRTKANYETLGLICKMF